ncbi:hypothetical protein B0H14DRAFT_2558958 [Mycena olivaceomarginata]|nr:hypothetical protein B0H14DRAFT_2558958 [Mycena olivaceomarginata]
MRAQRRSCLPKAQYLVAHLERYVFMYCSKMPSFPVANTDVPTTKAHMKSRNSTWWRCRLGEPSVVGRWPTGSRQMPGTRRSELTPWSETPVELVTEILLCSCGDYFSADNPFANDTVHKTLFIRRCSTFRQVSRLWCLIIDHTATFWSSHDLNPTQRRSAFQYITGKLTGTALHIHLVLRGPCTRTPDPGSDEIGLHAVMRLLQSKSERCASLGIYIEGRTVVTIVVDRLASCRFSRLTQLALTNVEPGWAREHPHTLDPTPDFVRLDDPLMCHLRLVGFSLSMRNNKNFRHIAVLVLGDLVRQRLRPLPSFMECYSKPIGQRPYLLGNWVGWIHCLSGSRLNKLHFLVGGNEAFNRLLELLRVLSLDMLDVRVIDARDCRSLLGCAELVHPFRVLRIYGAFNSNLDLLALSILMPDIAVLDVTMADRALARCVAMTGFKWTKGICAFTILFLRKCCDHKKQNGYQPKSGLWFSPLKKNKSGNLVTDEIGVGGEMRVKSENERMSDSRPDIGDVRCSGFEPGSWLKRGVSAEVLECVAGHPVQRCQYAGDCVPMPSSAETIHSVVADFG